MEPPRAVCQREQCGRTEIFFSRNRRPRLLPAMTPDPLSRRSSVQTQQQLTGLVLAPTDADNLSSQGPVSASTATGGASPGPSGRTRPPVPARAHFPPFIKCRSSLPPTHDAHAAVRARCSEMKLIEDTAQPRLSQRRKITGRVGEHRVGQKYQEQERTQKPP